MTLKQLGILFGILLTIGLGSLVVAAVMQQRTPRWVLK